MFVHFKSIVEPVEKVEAIMNRLEIVELNVSSSKKLGADEIGSATNIMVGRVREICDRQFRNKGKYNTS
jgi:hypothetical protein